jgi:hypothetical protein
VGNNFEPFEGRFFLKSPGFLPPKSAGGSSSMDRSGRRFIVDVAY